MNASRGTLRHLLSAAAIAAAILLVPAPALADCQPIPFEEAVRGSEFVFIGRVASVDAGGYSADVEVIEVWNGDVADRIVVVGGLDVANPAEDDRKFEVGVTYLFVPSLLEGHLVDSICSATTPWDEKAMAALRPGEVTAPQPVPTTEIQTGPLAALGDLVGPVLVVSIIGGLLLVTVLIAHRRET